MVPEREPHQSPRSRGAPGCERRAALIDTVILSWPFVEVSLLLGTEMQCENRMILFKKNKTKKNYRLCRKKAKTKPQGKYMLLFYDQLFNKLKAFPELAETLCVVVPLGL